jgi:hypothetical protein
MKRSLLTDGWFSSSFQPFIECISWLFPKSWLDCLYKCRKKKDRPCGLSERALTEYYVLGRLIFGVLWLWFINTVQIPFMSSCSARLIGAWFAVYLMTDIFVFTLKWIFVDTGGLEGVKRSLFFFFINIFEIALFSSVALILFRCTSKSPSCAVYESLRSIFKIELFKISDHCTYAGKFVIHFQLIAGVLLILVVIAGLAGSIREGKDKRGAKTEGEKN